MDNSWEHVDFQKLELQEAQARAEKTTYELLQLQRKILGLPYDEQYFERQELNKKKHKENILRTRSGGIALKEDAGKWEKMHEKPLCKSFQINSIPVIRIDISKKLSFINWLKLFK